MKNKETEKSRVIINNLTPIDVYYKKIKQIENAQAGFNETSNAVRLQVRKSDNSDKQHGYKSNYPINKRYVVKHYYINKKDHSKGCASVLIVCTIAIIILFIAHITVPNRTQHYNEVKKNVEDIYPQVSSAVAESITEVEKNDFAEGLAYYILSMDGARSAFSNVGTYYIMKDSKYTDYMIFSTVKVNSKIVSVGIFGHVFCLFRYWKVNWEDIDWKEIINNYINSK